MTSILKVDNIKDTSDNQAISISSGVATFNNLPVNASAAGSAAFLARNNVNAWVAAGDGSLVQFNDDSSGDCFDTDTCFDTSTYKFTAPATGVYFFWYSIYAADGDTQNTFGFLKNSSKLDITLRPEKHFSFFTSFSNDHIQNSQVLIPLSSGDTMGVCSTESNSDYFKGHSKWGGCRLA